MYGLHRSAIFTRFWWTFLLHCWIHSKVQYSRPCEEGPHQSRSCWKYQRIVVDITMKYTNKIEEPHVGLYPEILDWNKNDDTVRRDVVKKNLGKYLDFGRTLHWFWVYFYVFLDFYKRNRFILGVWTRTSPPKYAHDRAMQYDAIQYNSLEQY